MANQQVLQVRAWGSTGAYVDLVPYTALEGLKWTRNDIDAPNSGRDTQDGLMHRARVAIKTRLDVSCRPLLAEEATIVLQAISSEWLQVRYYDVQSGTILTKKMYSNNIPATHLMHRDGNQYWSGIAFPLIEQ